MGASCARGAGAVRGPLIIMHTRTSTSYSNYSGGSKISALTSYV